MNEIRRLLIEGINKRIDGHGPLIYIRGEADGAYGFMIYNENNVKGIDYAKDISPRLQDLSLMDLAAAIEEGKHGDDFEDFWECD